MTTVEKIIETLALEKHPVEGGYFIETYRSTIPIPRSSLATGTDSHAPYREKGNNTLSLSTAIYYLLVPGTFSEMHRLPFDEIFHFYSGSPVEMLQLFPGGTGKKIIIGSDILQGQSPQLIVPAGTWQGARLLPGLPGSKDDYALMGTTMAPGFDLSDYLPGKRKELIDQYPEFHDLIAQLTRQ